MFKIVFRCDYMHNAPLRREEALLISNQWASHYKFGVWKSENSISLIAVIMSAPRSITINYCACFVSITFNARDSAIIEPLCSHGLRIAMCSLMHNQCWISRALWNPRNKGIDNVTGYNKRKLIRTIVLARISGRPRRNSHICYYVCDRWNKYLPWFLPWGGPYSGMPVASCIPWAKPIRRTN